MLCFQTTAASLIDLMINHADVRPTIEQGDHRLSSLELLTDHRNVCLAGTGGAALFVWVREGVYKGHILLLKHARGSQGFAFGKAALAVMFDRHGALTVEAAVPKALPAARTYVRRLGFLSKGDSPDGLEELFLLEKPNAI